MGKKETIKCDSCSNIMIEDPDAVDTSRKYIQCPYCSIMLENPFYDWRLEE